MKFVRFLCVGLLSLALARFAPAQAAPDSSAASLSVAGLPSQILTRGSLELGVFSGGGLGLGKSDTTQFLYAGGRAGLILTGEHFHGWRRGNFEWAVDLMPLYTVFPPNSAVYGGSFKPVIWQWNFISDKRIVPYVAAAGGIIFSRDNIPPGDTSQVNFTSQFVTGARVFLKNGRTIFFEDAVGHLSNASLGNHNPGYNGLIEFTIGFSWFKSRK
ncbi:MAG TPA: acyloxyacyl hydrolase [Candidatus Acidoferrales bacterium]|nr:acyloxyacyl hydrolase [Candidatus Acidoferrales bacterium]